MGDKLHIKLLKKQVKKLEEQIEVLKTRRPDIYLKSEFDNMKTRDEVQRRKIKSLEEENKELREKLKQGSASKDPTEVNSEVLRAYQNP